jgi:hypothetical protein
MVEVEGETASEAAERVALLLPDAQVWGSLDPVEAALLVIGEQLHAAA